MIDLEEFPIDQLVWRQLSERIELSREIDKVEHLQRKEASQANWLKKAATDLDVDMDMEESSRSAPKKQKTKALTDMEEEAISHQQQVIKQRKLKLASLKSTLKSLLALPLVPKGTSRSFVTKNNMLFSQPGKLSAASVMRKK